MHNENVEDKPGLINKSPEKDAWLFELSLSDTSELEKLMKKDEYQNYLKSVTEDIDWIELLNKTLQKDLIY